MPRVNASEFAEKWARRTAQAVPDYQAGVEKVAKSPTEAAAAKKEKMLQKLTAAVQSGKWEARLRSVNLEQWKEAVRNKGVARIATGVQAARNDVQAFAEQLLSYEAALQSKIAAMPDMTLEDSINRVATWIREMAKFQRR
jgi:cytosine/adenosine deaminase-related metal-dependent hydrolase